MRDPPGIGEMPLKRKWSLMTEKTALLEADCDLGGVLTSVGSGSTCGGELISPIKRQTLVLRNLTNKEGSGLRWSLVMPLNM